MPTDILTPDRGPVPLRDLTAAEAVCLLHARALLAAHMPHLSERARRAVLDAMRTNAALRPGRHSARMTAR